jgi:hypothetical protein
MAGGVRRNQTMKRSFASLSFALVLVSCGLAAAEEVRPLKLEAVDEVIEHNDRAVQACARGARVRDTLAVLMHLEIDGDGRVITVEPSSGKPTPEAACLQRVARKLHFPSTGTISRVDYPFMLLPQIRR